MDNITIGFLIVIFTAYLFDFINGFHDAANSIATIVTTGVLTPKQAVLWAAFFNFIAFLFFNGLVAKTIGQELVSPALMNPHFVFSALLGAIVWNLLTWYWGLPSSSTHALIGGIAGAAIMQSGFSALKYAGFIKVAIGIFISPMLGVLMGLIIIFLLKRIFQRNCTTQLNTTFKGLQLVSSALLSITHGANDAQKTMAVITMLLFSAHWLQGDFYIPCWVIISCQAVISLGTLAGGWRIVHTLGQKITPLTTMHGCAAESGAALVIYLCTLFGIPVSTTQTVTGSIAGSGILGGLKHLNWSILYRIYLSWLLTVPASALIAACCICLFNLP